MYKTSSSPDRGNESDAVRRGVNGNNEAIKFAFD